MDKSLFFISMFLICLWLLMDDFIGQQRLSKVSEMIAPKWNSPIDVAKDKIKDTVDDIEKKYDEKMDKAKEKAEKNNDIWDSLRKKMKKDMPQAT